MSKKNTELLRQLDAAFEEACPCGWRFTYTKVEGRFDAAGARWMVTGRFLSEPGDQTRHVWFRGRARMGPEAVIAEATRYLITRGLRGHRLHRSPIIELKDFR